MDYGPPSRRPPSVSTESGVFLLTPRLRWTVERLGRETDSNSFQIEEPQLNLSTSKHKISPLVSTVLQ